MLEIISRYCIRSVYLTLFVFFYVGAARADEGPAHDQQPDLAKASQNPISSLISVPFENNAKFNTGPEDAYFNALLIKPVVAMKLTENWNLVNRAILLVL